MLKAILQLLLLEGQGRVTYSKDTGAKAEVNSLMSHVISVAGKARRSLIALKKEFELRKNANGKGTKETSLQGTNSPKGKEKANLVSNVVIEDLFDAREILCTTLSSDYASTLHVHSMQIIKWQMIDTLLIVNDSMNQI